MKLALGTVQFGLDYGVANKTGQVSASEITAILDECRSCGLDILDTAIGYGDSETRLGQAGVSDMRIVTKLPPLPELCADVEDFVVASVHGALTRLGTPQVYGLLLHHAADLVGPNGLALFSALEKIKAQGQTQKIGVSIYSPEILAPITHSFSIDLVQAPFNVIDQRLLASGWLSKLADMEIEVHTRSAFLQGLLLIPAASRPDYFKPWAGLLGHWEAFLTTHSLTPLEGTLGFLHRRAEIAHILVGVDNVTQLRAILASVKTQTVPVPAHIASDDLALIDPSIWSKF